MQGKTARMESFFFHVSLSLSALFSFSFSFRFLLYLLLSSLFFSFFVFCFPPLLLVGGGHVELPFTLAPFGYWLGSVRRSARYSPRLSIHFSFFVFFFLFHHGFIRQDRTAVLRLFSVHLVQSSTKNNPGTPLFFFVWRCLVAPAAFKQLTERVTTTTGLGRRERETERREDKSVSRSRERENKAVFVWGLRYLLAQSSARLDPALTNSLASHRSAVTHRRQNQQSNTIRQFFSFSFLFVLFLPFYHLCLISLLSSSLPLSTPPSLDGQSLRRWSRPNTCFVRSRPEIIEALGFVFLHLWRKGKF